MSPLPEYLHARPKAPAELKIMYASSTQEQAVCWDVERTLDCPAPRASAGCWSPQWLARVAWLGTKPVGYAAYDPSGTMSEVYRVAVSPGYRRRGIGSTLLRTVQANVAAGTGRRKGLVLHAAEPCGAGPDLAALLFLKACRFKAVPTDTPGSETRYAVRGLIRMEWRADSLRTPTICYGK